MATWEEYKQTMRRGEDPIFDRIREGDCLAVQGFLDQGGDVDLKNHKGYSLLMLAAYSEQLELCRLLMEAGADVNSEDHCGNTILMGVAFKGHADVIRLLLKYGADPRPRNRLGLSAHTFAKLFGRQEVAVILADATGERAEESLIPQRHD